MPLAWSSSLVHTCKHFGTNHSSVDHETCYEELTSPVTADTLVMSAGQQQNQLVVIPVVE